MKVLVTGGAGFIGSATCARLAAEGHEPITFDNLSTGHADLVRWGPLEVGDIRDRSALAAAFSRHRPDAVIHFAAAAYVGESLAAPGAYYDINVTGTRTVLDAMVAARIGSLVFSSSCATYGIPDALPIVEDTPQRPISPYGRTKLVGEWMLRDFAAAHGLRSVALRYFNAAGADAVNALSERHNPETHLIPRALMAAAGLIPHLDVFGADYPTPDGTCIRDYVHVVDLAEAHCLALRYLVEGGETVAINVGSGRGASIREIIDSIRSLFGAETPLVIAPRRTGDPPNLVADPAKLTRVLGMTCQNSDLASILASAGPTFGLSPRR